jgi:hypothetical protein
MMITMSSGISWCDSTLNPCEGFGANTVWIVTEADRSVTTFLLPSEY